MNTRLKNRLSNLRKLDQRADEQFDALYDNLLNEGGLYDFNTLKAMVESGNLAELRQEFPNLIPQIDRVVRSHDYLTHYRNRTDEGSLLQEEKDWTENKSALYRAFLNDVDTNYRKMQYELHLKSQHALEHERMALLNYQKFVQNPPTFHETQTYEGKLATKIPYMEAYNGPPQPDIHRMMHAGTYLKKVIHQKAQDPHNRYGKAVLLRHYNNVQQQMHQENMKKKRHEEESLRRYTNIHEMYQEDMQKNRNEEESKKRKRE